VILALGQDAGHTFLRSVPGVEFEADGTVQVSSFADDGCPECPPAATWCPRSRTVTVAVGHGNVPPVRIDAWLHGQPLRRPAKASAAGLRSC